MDLTAVLSWLSVNLVTVLILSYALLNVINGVLKLVPGDQGEEDAAKPGKGWVAVVRSVLDRISVITNHDAVGSVKLPGTKSKQ